MSRVDLTGTPDSSATVPTGGRAGAFNADAPGHAVKTTLRGLVSIVAPTTLVTALLYYFGWARTSAEAHALGLDDTLFGFSTGDYVLRSISSMFWALFVGVVSLLIGLLAHGAVTAFLNKPGGGGQLSSGGHLSSLRLRFVRVLSGALAALGLMSLGLGIAGARVVHPSRFVSLGAPVAVTLSVVLLSYAVYTFGRYVWRHRAGMAGAELQTFAPLAWTLVTVLLILSVFWSVSHYAGVKGVDLAIAANRLIPDQPSVVIYSAKRLDLQPPVVETAIGDEHSAYHYMYRGIKLLFRSDRQYFLRPSDPGDPRNIVLAESSDLRLEFSRGGP